jgi:hypothetical protein
MGCPRHRVAAVAAVLWTLTAGLIGMYLALFALSAAGRLARPVDEFTYGESWLLDGARRVANGDVLYAPPDQLPIMHIAYTPMYYVLVGELQRVFGDGGYTVGRVVSLAATLVGTTALMWSLRRLSGRWWVGLLGAGLFLTQNLTMLLWAPLERADPLALGITLVGLALATANRSSLAAVAFVLAAFTKQTFVVAPVAVAVALWPCRASLARFIAIFGGGSLLGVGLAQWLSHGWFLWHTVTANANEPDFGTFATLMGSFMQYNGLPVLAAVASLALPGARGERVWRLYFVGSLLTLASVAKLGASSNYWLEVTAATAALVALASGRLAAAKGTQLASSSMAAAARVSAPAAVAGALLIAVPAYQATAVEVADRLGELHASSSPQYLSLVGDSGTAAYRVDAGFVEQLAKEPGDLLTDNSGLAVAAGKRIAFEFQIFQLLEAEGHWSERPIVDAIVARRFSLVALMHPLDGPIEGTRWTPAIQSALRSAYMADGSEAGFWLYRPRA